MLIKEVKKMKQEEEIRKVLLRKDGVKMAIIPKKSKIDGGDYVRIIKVDKEVKK
jgi:hypothetical protein